MDKLTVLIKQTDLPLKQHYPIVSFYLRKMAGWMDKQTDRQNEINK